MRHGWIIFLIAALAALFIVLGSPPVGFVYALLGLVVLLIAWRFPLFAFYAALATAPMINWIVSISTGRLEIGDRAFGGSIDVGVGELVALAVLAVWAIRAFVRWRKTGERPWLPLAVSFGALVLAHFASIASFAEPDPLRVIKYSLRPVLLAYLVSVVLPVQFLRDERRFRNALLVLVAVALFAAFDSLRSLVWCQAASRWCVAPEGRLHPMPIFGAYPFGENHNILAEWMVFAAPAALAIGTRLTVGRHRRLAIVAAAFMAAVALLTFARSAWICLALSSIILLATAWRPWLKRHARLFVFGCIAFLPIAAYMVAFSSQAEVKSSTDARAMLTGIAWELFKDNPVVGVGAGMFADRVGRTWSYALEFGAAMDAHGILQKLAAETGLLGLIAFAAVLVAIALYARRSWRLIRGQSAADRRMYLYLLTGMIAAFAYQLFNTTYWTPKLWLPVGMFFAGTGVLLKVKSPKS